MKAAIYLFFIIGYLTTISGCGKYKDGTPIGPEPKQVMNRPMISGGIVLPVNGEIVTIDDVIGPYMEDLRPIAEKGDYLDYRRKARPIIDHALDNKISNIVLYQKAKKEAREDIDEQLDKAADTEIKRFIADFDGNYAKAEAAIKNMGMNWKSFRDYQRRSIMVQGFLYEEFKDKRPITYSDIVNHYEKIKNEQFYTPAAIQFRLIDILPSKVDVNDPNIPRAEAARNLASNIMTRLGTGEDFAKLAALYSATRPQQGGLWTPVTSGSLAKPYDVIEEKAKTMEPGQVAGPIEADDHIFIIKLENKRQAIYEPFEAVQHKVEVSLKTQRRRDAIDNFTKNLQNQADIGDQAAFVEQCIQKSFKDIKG